MSKSRTEVDQAQLRLLEGLVGVLDLDRLSDGLGSALAVLLDCDGPSIGDAGPGSPVTVYPSEAERIAFTLPAGHRTLEVRVEGMRCDPTFARELIERIHPLLVRLWAAAVEVAALRKVAETGTDQEARALLAGALADRGLTARQAEVLVLVAHGSSNADAARTLGLSERTVGKHLEHCYRRLEVSGRSQASDLVWRLAARRAADRRDAPPEPLAD